jgi:hypothetical protein
MEQMTPAEAAMDVRLQPMREALKKLNGMLSSPEG